MVGSQGSGIALHVSILTPTRALFEGDVPYVSFPSKSGMTQVFPGHTALSCQLGYGVISVGDGASPFTVFGGFAEIRRDGGLAIMTRASESLDSIDRDRAQQALRRAQERLGKTDPSVDFERARLAELRAQIRLHLLLQKGGNK